MPGIMDLITIVTIALIVSLILLGIKLNSLLKQKKSGKIKKIFDFRRQKTPPKNKTNKNLVMIAEDGLLKVKMPDIGTEEFYARLDRLKKFSYTELGEDEVFWLLSTATFINIGKKAAAIEKKLSLLKEDLYGINRLAELSEEEAAEIIQKTGFDRQVQWSKENAAIYKGLIEKHGSFKNYMHEEFGIEDVSCTNEQLIKLHKDLKMLFEGIGDASAWQFLTEMGFLSLKPDKVIRRILFRLGQIKSEEDFEGTIKAIKEISISSGQPVRYINLIFDKYGQNGESDLFGIQSGICTENEPKCDICTLTEFCTYNSMRTIQQ